MKSNQALASFINANFGLALAAYALAAAAWGLKVWLADKPERDARRILETFRDDGERKSALASLLGQRVPENLTGGQTLTWVKLQNRTRSTAFLLVAYLATLLAGVVVVGMALSESKGPEIHDAQPRLLDSSVERGPHV